MMFLILQHCVFSAEKYFCLDIFGVHFFFLPFSMYISALVIHQIERNKG